MNGDMSALQNNIPITQGLFGTTELDETRSAAIKKTYALLSLGVVAAIAGGFIGARTPALVQFFATYSRLDCGDDRPQRHPARSHGRSA